MKSKRNLFMSVTLMSAFLIVTFKFDVNTIQWMWEGEIQVPVILGIMTLVFLWFWISEQGKLKFRK